MSTETAVRQLHLLATPEDQEIVDEIGEELGLNTTSALRYLIRAGAIEHLRSNGTKAADLVPERKGLTEWLERTKLNPRSWRPVRPS